MWICSRGLIDRWSFLVADIFFARNPPCAILIIFAHGSAAVAGCSVTSRFKCIPTYYSWKDRIVFSLISNWLMLLAWWGCCSGGFRHQAAICMMRGNCSRCIHFVPLSSSLVSPYLFFVIPVEVNNCMVLCWAISLFFLTASICRIELPFKHK